MSFAVQGNERRTSVLRLKRNCTVVGRANNVGLLFGLLVVAVASVFVSSPRTVAQTVTGTIVGTVLDSQGAADYKRIDLRQEPGHGLGAHGYRQTPPANSPSPVSQQVL